MSFRTGETSEFPIHIFNRTVWYGIIEYDETIAQFSKTSFTASKSGLKDLTNMIKLLSSENRKFEVLGMWQGAWKTDVFVLEPELLVKRLQPLI